MALFFNSKQVEKSLSSTRRVLLGRFQKTVDFKFKNIMLLDKAFYHRSFANEVSLPSDNNERLEFLGDSVLALITASFIYKKFEKKAEGDLAKIKSVVVSEETLSRIALLVGIDKCLCLGRGEEQSGGRAKKALLADAMEAVIGAMYLDGGYKATEKAILPLLEPEIFKVNRNQHKKDYKTLLQELYQKEHQQCPRYSVIDKSGPAHNQVFTVTVTLGHTVYGPAQGKNKKEAEQGVARIAWERLTLEK